MSNLIQLYTYRFAPDIIKYENDGSQIEQHIIIALKRDDSPYSVISPATSLLKCWSLKDKTMYDYARRFCEFLNYAYFVKRIKCFTEIDTNLVADFINYLGKEHTRDYVKVSINILKKIFLYASFNYPNICQISKTDIYAGTSKNKSQILWPSLDSKIIMPSKNDNKNQMNRLTNLEDDIVFRFLDIAKIKTPNCAFGFYFLFFGGLRSSEVLHLTDADIPSRISKTGMFYVNLKDEILNAESKFSDISQNKRNRKQVIIIIPELFEPLKEIYKKGRSGGAIVKNRFGQPMTDRGFRERFTRVKNSLIKELENSSNPANKLKAYQLKSFDWDSHIGRGYFSNLCARYAKNPYGIAVARGDSGFDSVLPYLAESEETSKEISAILSQMYKKGRRVDEESS